MLLLGARVYLGPMAIKVYSAFPKAPALPSDCLRTYQNIRWKESYPFAKKLCVYFTAPADGNDVHCKVFPNL